MAARKKKRTSRGPLASQKPRPAPSGTVQNKIQRGVKIPKALSPSRSAEGMRRYSVAKEQYLILRNTHLQALMDEINEINRRDNNEVVDLIQVIEPGFWGVDYRAIVFAYCVPSPQDNVIRPNYDPLLDWLRKKMADESPPQTVVED